MESKDVWKVFVSAWLGTAIAVVIGVILTHSAWCLWALFIPAMLKTESKAYTSDEKRD